MRAVRWLMFVVLLVGAGWQLGHSVMILAKAELAQLLIANAWQQNRHNGAIGIKPWAWADTTPVARLTFPRQRESLMVLSGDSGRVMAFGPGHNLSTPLPGRGGNSVISGHRDTHFAVLQNLQPNDEINVETPDGSTVTYRISHTRVVDKSRVDVMRDNGTDELTLVTCWPFNSLQTNGPDRFIVSAQRVSLKLTLNQPEEYDARHTSDQRQPDRLGRNREYAGKPVAIAKLPVRHETVSRSQRHGVN